MKLKILRGAHDLDMVDSVYELIQDVDVLFLEFIGTKEQKRTYERTFNDLTSDETFANSDEALKFKDFPDPYARLGYLLRGSKVRICLVDDYLQDGESLKAYINKSTTFFSDAVIDALQPTPDTPPDFAAVYDSVSNVVDQNLARFRRRDKLVAQQVAAVIKQFEEQGIKHDTMALVQGYVHWSSRFLKVSLPDLELQEIKYNTEGVRLFLKLPYNQLIRAKLAHPKEPLSHREVYMAVAVFLEEMANDHETTEYSTAGYVLRDDPTTLRFAAYAESLAKLDTIELQRRITEVVALIEDKSNTKKALENLDV